MRPDSVQLSQEAVIRDTPAVTVQREQKKSATEAVTKNQQAVVEAEKTEKAAAAKKVTEKDKVESPSERREKDQANLHFSLSAPEKEAFQKYFERVDQPEEVSSFLSEEDYETIQKAAERITEAMDETLDRYQKSNDRVNKAVSEWYLQLAKGNTEPKLDFVQFLRDASMGKFDY